MKVKFVIPGEPQDIVLQDAKIRTEYREQVGAVRFSDKEKIYIRITAFHSISTIYPATTQKQMETGALRPDKHPAAYDIIKAVAESLNDIAYRTTTQIVDCQVRKYFSRDPRIEVMIATAQ